MKPEFEVISAPGLPTWPRLLLDKQRQRAVVTIRLATWRSCLHAHAMSKWAGWCINLTVAWLSWQRLGFIENPIGRGMLTLVGVCVVAAVTKPLMPAAFDHFLARRLFSRRSTVWFTPEAIAFRSRMYENGVVVPRNWQGHPVQVRFDTGPDPEAVTALSHQYGQQRRGPGLQTARILRLVITAFDPQRNIARSTQGQLARAIPMLPLDLQDAQRLTVVLSAAAELTSPVSFPTAQPVPGPDAGLDIDANPT